MINERHGRLTIVSEPFKVVTGKYVRFFVLTLCDCGVEKEIRLSHIKAGAIQSCGCFRDECNLNRSITHGLTSHPLYGVWCGMKERCYNPKGKHFQDYGGRGVRMCKQWRNDFKVFYDWAIDKWERGLNLDKDILAPTKTGKLYCPQYCCFVTRKENNRHRRNTLTYDQVSDIKQLYSTGDYTMDKIGKMYGVGATTISAITNNQHWV